LGPGRTTGYMELKKKRGEKVLLTQKKSGRKSYGGNNKGHLLGKKREVIQKWGVGGPTSGRVEVVAKGTGCIR